MTRPQGFTLLEILVAMVVLSVAVVGSTIALRASLQAANHARLAAGALEIAKRELTQAIIADAASLQDRSGSSGRYGWTLSYSTKSLGLSEARVHVAWQEHGLSQKLQISEVFQPRGGGGGGQ